MRLHEKVILWNMICFQEILIWRRRFIRRRRFVMRKVRFIQTVRICLKGGVVSDFFQQIGIVRREKRSTLQSHESVISSVCQHQCVTCLFKKQSTIGLEHHSLLIRYGSVVITLKRRLAVSNLLPESRIIISDLQGSCI